MKYEQNQTKYRSGAERCHFFVPRSDPFDPEKECKPLRPLSKAEQEKVAANRAAVYEHMPDMLPFFKDLHEAGMIDGWRGVGEVELLKEGDRHGND